MPGHRIYWRPWRSGYCHHRLSSDSSTSPNGDGLAMISRYTPGTHHIALAIRQRPDQAILADLLSGNTLPSFLSRTADLPATSREKARFFRKESLLAPAIHQSSGTDHQTIPVVPLAIRIRWQARSICAWLTRPSFNDFSSVVR